jgi:hypothetical protein
MLQFYALDAPEEPSGAAASQHGNRSPPQEQLPGQLEQHGRPSQAVNSGNMGRQADGLTREASQAAPQHQQQALGAEASQHSQQVSPSRSRGSR